MHWAWRWTMILAGTFAVGYLGTAAFIWWLFRYAE